MKASLALILVSVLVAACTPVSDSASRKDQESALTSGFVKSLLTGGLSNASAMEFAPDGRLFVLERGTNGNGTGGTATAAVRVIKNGSLLATPFVNITVDNTAFSCCNERGLVGITFDPGFASNHFLYVYYTVAGSPAHNRVSRFTANGDVAVVGSEQIIVELDSLSAPNHNGGAIHFGTDGKLYIDVGNNVVNANSQSLTNRHGKILRLNADGTIPSDNPTSFSGISGSPTGVNKAIWAVGFRNPFTAAINPATGQMFVNDVGESTREEIDDLVKGHNYGWSLQEGFLGADDPNFTRPVIDYAHGDQGACAITGGTFYHPATNTFGASYLDKYFFADYCGGWVRLLDPSTRAVTTFDSGYNGPVDLKAGLDGALYVLARGSGEVWRIQQSGAPTQALVLSTATLTVDEASSGTFTVKLAAQPSANVVVNVAPTAGPSTVTTSPSALTFTSSNWSTAQTVTVAAANDNVVGNESATITCSSSGLASQTVNVTVIDNDTAATAPTAQISLPHNGDTVSGTNVDYFGQGIPGGTRVLAINAGGAAAAPFVADTDVSGGTVSSGTTAAIDTSTVTNPAPQAVYQSGRWGNFTYTIPGLSAGKAYTLRLHFAEYIYASTGQRVFNVAIGGTQVLTNFDILAAAGAKNRAVIREFAATADASGTIAVAFTNVVDHAIVQGLEVFLGGATVVKAEFYIDGALKYTDVKNAPPDHYHYLGSHSSWDTTLLANGSHALAMKVYDIVGASGSHQITVTVNNATGTAKTKLLFSSSATRSPAVPLAGATVSGAVYVFTGLSDGTVAGTPPVSSVTYTLDNGAFTHTENFAPYDFNGTTNAYTFTPGSHVIKQVVTFTDGTQETDTATFTM
jgi:glucose/arabinose dehydrogenase